MLKAVKVTCENGRSWSTSVSANSTQESLDQYFLGSMFNVGSYPDEVMSRCVKVELLTPQVSEFSRKLQSLKEPMTQNWI